MRYQLVLQMPGVTVEDFDRLIAIEEAVQESVGDLGDVDGHDMGAGEMNIFVLTDSPSECFQRMAASPEVRAVLTDLKAAYRDIDGADYTAIYPHAGIAFKVA